MKCREIQRRKVQVVVFRNDCSNVCSVSVDQRLMSPDVVKLHEKDSSGSSSTKSSALDAAIKLNE